MLLTNFQMTGQKRQILISMCLYLGQMVVGFGGGWTGPILLKLRDHEESLFGQKLSGSQHSLIASLLLIGCIPGPYIVGWLSNSKGRKPCLLLSGIISTIAYAILATTKNLAMLYTGRFLSGIGVGILAQMNVVYIGELASTNIRGILLTVVGIFTTCGCIVLYSSAFWLSYYGINNVGVIISLTFTLSLFFVPESPMFYIIKGNREAVVKTLQSLGRSSDIEKLIGTKNVLQETNAKTDWIELFKIRSNRKAFLIVTSVCILQHCSGVLILVLFAGFIFDKAASTMNPNISLIIITAFQLLGSCISPFMVEKYGRKILLVSSAAVCSITMLLLGFYFYLDHLGSAVVENIKWFPIVIIVIYFVGFDFGLGVIPHTLLGEMFTTNVRSNGSTTTLTVTWVVGFIIVTVCGPYVNDPNVYVVFWIFSAMCCFNVIFTIFCVLETKGKTLLEIQEILGK